MDPIIVLATFEVRSFSALPVPEIIIINCKSSHHYKYRGIYWHLGI